MLAIYKHLFLQSEFFVTEKRAYLLLSFIMLKNGRTCFKNFAVFTFLAIFQHYERKG